MNHTRSFCLSTALALLAATGPAIAQSAPAFSLEVQLDPATLAELESRGEMVVVSGWFFGDPAPGSTVTPDEMGYIYLASEELTIWPKASVTLTLGNNLGSAPLAEVVAPMVNINVYTARHTDENNLLDCGLVDGPLADLTKTPQVITCKLIGG